ncbi:MAG: prolipoprotein diacylglyceryl transferase [Patescibacteria group bacterium]|nr:prolipoprotein diacylglyceryl transferase [Patescibacteria group bacterium]MDD5490652.1 prolipoprotein diacylglyceryl transferase [Patescibacteria group bacterium]
MLPYIKITTINFWPVEIQFWGLLAALGIVIAGFGAYREAKSKSLSLKKFWDLFFWVVVAALIGGRIFHIVFYEWGYYSKNLWDILKIWQGGMSLFGGLAGAFAVAIIFIRRHNLNFWEWADIFIFFLPLGLFFGRIGCFFIHDHPGILTDSFLGVAYPVGARYDLGLILALSNLILFLFFLFLRRRERSRGFYLSVFFIWFGAVRFLSDFLRAWDLPGSDFRWHYLTPAQYLSLVMIFLGLYFFYKRKKL